MKTIFSHQLLFSGELEHEQQQPASVTCTVPPAEVQVRSFPAPLRPIQSYCIQPVSLKQHMCTELDLCYEQEFMLEYKADV